VFASGGGSNLQAILDHLDDLGAAAPAEVALVVSDREDAKALERARSRGCEAVHLPASRSADLRALLDAHRIALIALAGYLRLVPADVVAAFRGRMLNIHPSLLPAFGGKGMYGDRVHRAVLESGVRVSGATVHFIDERFDEGAVIVQWPVPVRTDDTPATLGARVLAVEHRIFPWAVAAVARGAVTLDDAGRVAGSPEFDFDIFAPEPRRHPFIVAG
jgi:formyltetrahydrofolate-dependent phosphoribosylglycinamide formyltransferase